MSHNRLKVGVTSKRTYVFFFFFRVERLGQIALHELNLISKFNFNLVLSDIIANITPGESALPGKFFCQLYMSKPFALTPCLGDLAFFLFSFAYYLFFIYVKTRDN